VSGERRLLVRRRLCAPADRAEYDARWSSVVAAATSGGARAWRFRSEERGDLFVEFLEFSSPESDPRRREDASRALAALDAALPEDPPPSAPLEAWRAANP
jgi:hypothetical protein